MKKEDWIKVEDRLPENDDLVLIRCEGIWGDRLIDLYYVGSYMVSMEKWVGDGLFNDFPTHWMPIVPPKEKCKGVESGLSSLKRDCKNFEPKKD